MNVMAFEQFIRKSQPLHTLFAAGLNNHIAQIGQGIGDDDEHPDAARLHQVQSDLATLRVLIDSGFDGLTLRRLVAYPAAGKIVTNFIAPQAIDSRTRLLKIAQQPIAEAVFSLKVEPPPVGLSQAPQTVLQKPSYYFDAFNQLVQVNPRREGVHFLRGCGYSVSLSGLGDCQGRGTLFTGTLPYEAEPFDLGLAMPSEVSALTDELQQLQVFEI